MGVRPYRHGDLRRPGRAARAVHRHRGHRRRHDAAGGQRWMGALLARRRDRVARRDGIRALRRHARHRVGQHVSDHPLPVVRRHRGGHDRPRHGRVPAGGRIDARLAFDRTPADARARVAVVLLQLHIHSAVLDRISAHRNLLPDGATARLFPQNRRPLPGVHAGDLAAVGLSRRGRQSSHRHSRRQGQGRSAGDARRRQDQRCPPTAAINCGRRRPETM